jgi:hypothetical protein
MMESLGSARPASGRSNIRNGDLLIFLEDSDHFLEPDVIDEMVCAELPDPSWDQDGELAGVIRLAMIHGPCGEHNPQALAWTVDVAPSGIRGTSVRKPWWMRMAILSTDGL